ncbi:MAG: GNAT family N-acetyltransferase [Pseudomonadales bacterium]|nr:GNAT family N-acetyltransferase [Pseudomonadales bacterium]
MNESVISVASLSTANESDFFSFFDGDAFSDNPEWSSCYCQCFYEDHEKIVWKEQTAARNRQKACERLRAQSMQGYLAYIDSQPVGWCGAAPRRLLRALDDEPIPDAEQVGNIVCFLVSPSHRRQGIAKALLDAACRGLAAQGLAIAEANPQPDAKTDAENHVGPLSLYLASGFEVHREDHDGSVYVRRSLLQGAS